MVNPIQNASHVSPSPRALIPSSPKASTAAKAVFGKKEATAQEIISLSAQRIQRMNTLSLLFSSALLVATVFFLVVGIASGSAPFMLTATALFLSSLAVMVLSIASCRFASRIDTLVLKSQE